MIDSFREKSKSRISEYIENIRESDEQTRKIWVAVLSGISMVFVLAIWVSYISVTVSDIPSSELAKAVSAQNAKKGNPIIANFKRNTSIIYNDVKSFVLGITNKGNDIIIEK